MLENMGPGKNIWIVVHERAADMGSFGEFFAKHGIDPTVFVAPETNFANLNASEPDVLIIMGGPMGVYEAGIYPWMTPEINFIQRRIEADKPLLGVCLGSQMIASALGARVFKGKEIGKEKEIGLHPVTMNYAGMQTPLRHLDASQTYITHWHGDTFELPRGAMLLGSSAKYENQAYSYGDKVMAVQFHPEVNERVLRYWKQDFANELAEVGSSREQLRADFNEHGERLKQANFKFITGWLEDVSPQTLAANDYGRNAALATRQPGMRLTPSG